MKKAIFLIFVFFSAKSIATTWRPAYPYTQKTENGKVKCVSFPYGGNRGPYGLGETFISCNGKLIYTIDKYFSTPFFTINNGQYLIEFNFRLDYQNPYYLIEPNGKWTLTPIKYEGNAIHIYKNGKIFKNMFKYFSRKC